MVVKIHKADNGELFFKLEDILEGTNVSPEDVDSYELTAEGETATLVLYDKAGKLILVTLKGKDAKD